MLITSMVASGNGGNIMDMFKNALGNMFGMGEKENGDPSQALQQAGDIGMGESAVTGEGMESIAGTEEGTIAEEQFKSVHASAQGDIAPNTTAGAEAPLVGGALGLKGRENEKDLAQMIHKDVSFGGVRMVDPATGEKMSIKDTEDALYNSSLNAAHQAENSTEVAEALSKNMTGLKENGKLVIDAETQIHGSKVASGIGKAFDEEGIDEPIFLGDGLGNKCAEKVADAYGLEGDARKEIMPELKKIVGQGLSDSMSDRTRPTGESAKDCATRHIMDKMEKSGMFDKLPIGTIKEEFEKGTLGGAKALLSNNSLSQAAQEKSGEGRTPSGGIQEEKGAAEPDKSKEPER